MVERKIQRAGGGRIAECAPRTLSRADRMTEHGKSKKTPTYVDDKCGAVSEPDCGARSKCMIHDAHMMMPDPSLQDGMNGIPDKLSIPT